MAKKKETPKHWTDIREDLEAYARNWSLMRTAQGDVMITAAGQLEAVKFSWRRNYPWPAAELQTPCTDALAKLEADPEKVDAARRFRKAYGLELLYESKAVTFAKMMEDTAEKRVREAEQAAADRRAAHREQQVEAKLSELQADHASKAAAELRRQAERAVG